MQRIVEPELMNEFEQAKAYAMADFSEPHNHFIELFKQTFPEAIQGLVLDLGCGPADISIRFAKAFSETIIHGLDGAEAMLAFGREAIAKHDLQHRIELYQSMIQSSELPLENYDVIISNSLLHHIHEPFHFWNGVKQFSNPSSKIFIMDLMRPESESVAEQLVYEYAKDEPEVLQKDFFNSLKAAFTVDEVKVQLQTCGLEHLEVTDVSDRHLIIHS